LLVDVRTEAEFAEARKWINQYSIRSTAKPIENSKEKSKLLFFAEAKSHGHAKMILEQNGFKNVINAAHGKTYRSDS
jgi:rhodanese-related sulfurtransferase